MELAWIAGAVLATFGMGYASGWLAYKFGRFDD